MRGARLLLISVLTLAACAAQSGAPATTHADDKPAPLVLPEPRLPRLPPPAIDANTGHPGAPLMDNDSVAKGFRGTLLAPIEPSPAFRRPDRLLINHNGVIRIFDAATMIELTPPGKPIALPDNVPTALLGYSGDLAILIQAKTVLALNLKTQLIAWTIQFLNVPADFAARQSELSQHQIQSAQTAKLAGQQVEDSVVYYEYLKANVDNTYFRNVAATLNADQARAFAFGMLNHAGQHEVAFSTMNLIGNKLITAANGDLVACDIATGKPAWMDPALAFRLPEGICSVIVGNDDFVVAEIATGDNAVPVFCIVDAHTGKLLRQIRFAGEHVFWRAVSREGILYVLTDKALAAYDLAADKESPLWRREDMPTRYPGATALTHDGLMLVNAKSELTCLSLKDGKTLWPPSTSSPIRLELPSPQDEVAFLHAYVNDDKVIYQSAEGIVACYSAPRSAEDGQIDWKATFTPGRTPPLANLQLSDQYAVVLASGPLGTAQRAVTLLFIGRKAGKRRLEKAIMRNSDDSEGPLIRNWQVLDNGVALEANGSVYLFRGKK